MAGRLRVPWTYSGRVGWLGQSAQCSVASYILQMRDKLDKMRHMVQEHLRDPKPSKRCGMINVLERTDTWAEGTDTASFGYI